MARRNAKATPLKVAVVTGTRAEFGLLTPVMHAIQKHPKLALQVIASGAHLLPPARTIKDVRTLFPIAATVPMQRPGKSGRHEDALALARGIDGFARAFAKLTPDWVVVLGDRIEAFAAASAASVAGIAVCHIHGGDRAEGIADEAMRHAITKLSHLHCAATKLSAQRIIKMGEKPEHVHVTGSPAIDGLKNIKPMSDAEAKKLGDPRVVMLLHPSASFPSSLRLDPRALKRALGSHMPKLPAHPRFVVDAQSENRFAMFAYMATTCLPDEPPLGPCQNLGMTDCGGNGPRGIFLAPNHDPGHDQILARWKTISSYNGWPVIPHLPRHTFVSLLKRMAHRKRGLLVGNSSAGLIECAAIGLPVLNLGHRQAGRERGPNVVDADPLNTIAIVRLIRKTDSMHEHLKPSTLFGDGRAAPRIANLLAATNPREPSLLRKRIVY